MKVYQNGAKYVSNVWNCCCELLVIFQNVCVSLLPKLLTTIPSICVLHVEKVNFRFIHLWHMCVCVRLIERHFCCYLYTIHHLARKKRKKRQPFLNGLRKCHISYFYVCVCSFLLYLCCKRSLLLLQTIGTKLSISVRWYEAYFFSVSLVCKHATLFFFCLFDCHSSKMNHTCWWI